MTTSNLQYRVEFTEITAFGNKKASTIWMNTLEEAQSSKWMDRNGATIITREKPQTQTFAEWKANRNK